MDESRGFKYRLISFFSPRTRIMQEAERCHVYSQLNPRVLNLKPPASRIGAILSPVSCLLTTFWLFVLLNLLLTQRLFYYESASLRYPTPSTVHY